MLLSDPCPFCQSPREPDPAAASGAAGRRSSHCPAAIGAAAMSLFTVRGGYLAERPLLEEGLLDPLIGQADAARVRRAFLRLLAQALRCLGEVERTCPACRAPVREQGDGLLWHGAGDEGFGEALDDLLRLRLHQRPPALGPGNPYYRPGDEAEPFVSVAPLRAVLGRHPASEVLNSLERLARALGARERIGVRT